MKSTFKYLNIFSIGVLIVFKVSHCSGTYVPPLESEWEVNPNVFSNWPKTSANDMRSNSKSPSLAHQTKIPVTTTPIEYFLQIRPIIESEIDEEELTAPGSVQIRIKCLVATDKIYLHSNIHYVTINENTVKVFEYKGGKPTTPVPVVDQTYEVDDDFYIIHMASKCRAYSEYLISIDFVADIATDHYTGLYLSHYTDPDTNVTKKLATTQMEDEHSRQMFPNYDHPSFKAKFHITIGRTVDYNTMSNMNLIKTEKDSTLEGWYWDHYAPTPKMSSYLVALVVSDFICVSAPPNSYKKHVEVCGPQYMIRKGGGDHSTEVVANILKFYDGFMGQPYPLPKMTSAAIPHFQAGAMENWGMNTYRLKGLMVYKGITSEADRYRVDLTISHELAHQNFGNLVTCALWNQIWLNEGFATYISYYGLNSSSPEYEPEKQWITSYRRRALLTDASIKTRPMVNVSNPASYFDGISYSKGASLIKTMETFLTDKVLFQGLKTYLAKYAYSTATQWDLFEVLDKQAFVSNVHPNVATVSEIMETWTLQRGFPLIRVDYISNGVIHVSQERFYETGQSDTSLPELTWFVPIITSTEVTQPIYKKVPITWLTGKEPFKRIHLDNDFQYIIVNPNGGVYVRVLYDTVLMNLIENALENSAPGLSAVTRSQLIDDGFENAWAGYGSVEAALNLTRYLGREPESVVWTSALNGFGRISTMFQEDKNAFNLLKLYIGKRILSSLSLIGIDQGPNDKGMLVIHRATMLGWGGMLQLPEVLSLAQEYVAYWRKTGNNRTPPDLHSQTYCNAVIGGGKDAYDFLLAKFADETNDDIKDALAKALACSIDEKILDELKRNLTEAEFGIPPVYGSQILYKLARNTISRKSLLKYIDENFDNLSDYFGTAWVIARTLENAALYWNTEDQLKQLEDFLLKYGEEFQQMSKYTQMILAQVEENILWMKKFAQPIELWLNANQ